MKDYTDNDLKEMTPEKRVTLYQNALRLFDSGGKAIIEQLTRLGLPLSSGGMRMSDPTYIEMERIIWSPEGRKAAIEATGKGLPALAGVERLFVDALGDLYHPHDGGTVNAGFIVGELMRHLGYVPGREGSMPEGSVAKTAMKWIPRKG
jgi:hypothetical protein